MSKIQGRLKEWKGLEFIEQRHWFTSVKREDENYIIAQTDYMDTGIERRTTMRVEMSTLKIESAWLDRLGRPGDLTEERQYIEDLKGVEAYLGSGRQLRAALQHTGDALERSLFNDCVVGIVQAETFFFPMRGYRDAADYNRFWEEAYVGSCRYYSNLDLVQIAWMDFIGSIPRQSILFSRSKSQQLMRNVQESYMIAGSLVDTFHQMASLLVLSPEMTVIEASGQLIRTPDQVCMAAADLMANLVGQNLSGIGKKELAGLMGANQGCIHLIDLVYDSVQTVKNI